MPFPPAATLIAAWLLLALPAAARAEGGELPPIVAGRAVRPVVIDGRIDEAEWAAAPAFDRFVEIFPEQGTAPGLRTEVRVLQDARALYVAIRCEDPAPEEISHPLGRRDSPPASDLVQVYVDAGHAHRSAALFVVTAGGVVADGMVYDDDRITYDWDAAWEGAAVLLPGGWSAELAIPLSVLRTRTSGPWGFGVVREVARTHARYATMLLPRNARGLVSRLGHLEGVEDFTGGADLELTPHAVARAALRPQYADPARPRPRIADPALELGLDLSARLGPQLSLVGTLNPDFGQVEADQILLNLSNSERWLPEKRPFFNEGLDVFKSVGDGNEQPPQQLFYSRRIGLDAPIFAAAKVVGRPAERLELGLLDAVVGGTGARLSTESEPARSLRWSWAQPLRLAPDLGYPTEPPLARNYFAGVLRFTPAERWTVGAQATSALALTAPCTEAEARPADPGAAAPARCTTPGGDALAADFNFTSGDGEWYAYGQAAASRAESGPPTRVLQDGVALRRGDLGAGGYLRAGRRGGEPWRFELAWSYASPRLDLNPTGFQGLQNVQGVDATLRFVRPSGGGPFHDYGFLLQIDGQWTTDGSSLERLREVTLGAGARWKALYLNTECLLDWVAPHMDPRELRVKRDSEEGAGIALERAGWLWSMCNFESDPARAFSVSGSVSAGRNIAPAPLRRPTFRAAELHLTWRPHPRVESRLGASWDESHYAIRYVDGGGALPFLLGELTAPSLSLVLRQTLVLTQRLSLQAYAQLFTAHGRYGPFYTADAAGRAIHAAGVRPVDPTADPAFLAHDAAPFREANLVLNAVLRWEYRLGGTLYLVYARNQAEGPGAFAGTLLPRGLSSGPVTDSLLFKASWRYAP